MSSMKHPDWFVLQNCLLRNLPLFTYARFVLGRSQHAKVSYGPPHHRRRKPHHGLTYEGKTTTPLPHRTGSSVWAQVYELFKRFDTGRHNAWLPILRHCMCHTLGTSSPVTSLGNCL